MINIYRSIVALMLSGALSAAAQTIEYQGVWYSLTDDSSPAAAEVVAAPAGGALYTGEIEIASKVRLSAEDTQEYEVTAIADHAFAGCAELTGVDIPESVARIGDYAFFGCSSMRRLTLREGLRTIGDRSFTDCCALEELKLPESLESVGENAFSRCNSIPSVTFPDRFERIGDGAFSYCDGLETIDFSTSQIEYGVGAFQGCHNLKNLLFNPAQERIQAFTFAGCSALESLKLPGALRYIGEQAFADCIKLRQVDFPASMQEVGPRAFAAALSLDSIGFYARDMVIGDAAFEGASNLERVIISGVRRIGEGAFRSGMRLNTVELGSMMEEIGVNVFQTCPSLQAVYSRAQLPPLIYTNTFTSAQEQSATLYVLPGLRRRYMLATHWSRFEHVVETGSFPSSSDPVADVQPRIEIVKGGAQIMGEDVDMKIFSLDGIEMTSLRVLGSEFVELSPGMYVVVVNGRSQKLCIR